MENKKFVGAICGGNREEAWEWVKEAKTEKEYMRRLDAAFMAIM